MRKLPCAVNLVPEEQRNGFLWVHLQGVDLDHDHAVNFGSGSSIFLVS